MLHYLRTEDATQCPIRKRLQESEHIRALRRQAFRSAQGHALFAKVDASRHEAGLARDIQEFASATSDIENLTLRTRESGHVPLLMFSYPLLGPAEDIAEAHPIDGNVTYGSGRRPSRSWFHARLLLPQRPQFAVD